MFEIKEMHHFLINKLIQMLELLNQKQIIL